MGKFQSIKNHRVLWSKEAIQDLQTENIKEKTIAYYNIGNLSALLKSYGQLISGKEGVVIGTIKLEASY